MGKVMSAPACGGLRGSLTLVVALLFSALLLAGCSDSPLAPVIPDTPDTPNTPDTPVVNTRDLPDPQKVESPGDAQPAPTFLPDQR